VYLVRYMPHGLIICSKLTFIASREFVRGEVIEISPVLLFSAEEYGMHGKYTVLDHYTFNWRDGRMALALGLGM
jgi:tRNA-specific adenosine deaminase 3